MTQAQCTWRYNQIKQQSSRNKQGIQAQRCSCQTSCPQCDLGERSFPGDSNAGPCPCETCVSHLSSLSLSFLNWKMGLQVSSWGCEHQWRKQTCGAKPRVSHSPVAFLGAGTADLNGRRHKTGSLSTLPLPICVTLNKSSCPPKPHVSQLGNGAVTPSTWLLRRGKKMKPH